MFVLTTNVLVVLVLLDAADLELVVSTLVEDAEFSLA